MCRAVFLLICIVVVSCNEAKKNYVKNVASRETLSMGDMPNETTTYDTIYTQKSVGNPLLINALKIQLNKHRFNFKEDTIVRTTSYNNCAENKTIIIDRTGVKQYFARSIKPKINTKNYYPDFIIWEYSFTTPEIAQQHFEQLNNALHSAGRFCNGKAPDKLVLKQNQIFHLGTRAEMFRGYIEQYGEWIKNYR